MMEVGNAIIGLLKRLDEDSPFIICIAGPNGAGKSTLYPQYIKPLLEYADCGYIYLNADDVSLELRSEAQLTQLETDKRAQSIISDDRQRLIDQEQSFVFETVFSHSDKVKELQLAREKGYTVLLIFVGLESASLSKSRVKRRVKEGGHNVPDQKLEERFPRTLQNLQDARTIACGLLVLDNSSPTQPFQVVKLQIDQLDEFENSSLKNQWQRLAPLLF